MMLFSVIKKEFLLVRRDIHAVMVLFVMPVAFILIMSLSLQDTFQKVDTEKPSVGIIFEAGDEVDSNIKQLLFDIDGFRFIQYKNVGPKKIVIDDKLIAAIEIPQNYLESFSNRAAGEMVDKEKIPALQLYYAPTTPESIRKLLYTSINLKLAMFKSENILSGDSTAKESKPRNSISSMSKSVIENELYSEQVKQPSSVEQTVPAWLIFSMFFVVIPISTTFLIEKNQGTLQRLKTMPVPGSYFLLGKFLPYLVINLIQTVLMFLVGIFLLPLLGGQALSLSENAWLLVPMSLAVSVAAISFALLIAAWVKTTEQATTIGGVSNLILGAIGGVMVPTFVMPEMMQNFARVSPMNWGLEGYLTIILRQGTLPDVLPEIFKLFLFGLVMFSLAIWFYKREKLT